MFFLTSEILHLKSTWSTFRLRSRWPLMRPPLFPVLAHELLAFLWAVCTGFVFVEREGFPVFGYGIYKLPCGFYFVGADKQTLVPFHKVQEQAFVSSWKFPFKGFIVAKI